MTMTRTEAWVIDGELVATQLKLAKPEELDLRKNMKVREVDVEDFGSESLEFLVGDVCAEGNMHHAATGKPINSANLIHGGQHICGNAGWVLVTKVGDSAAEAGWQEGDLAVLQCGGERDELDHPMKIFGYDEKGVMGLLRRGGVLPHWRFRKMRLDAGLSLRQWAAVSLRHPTAWELLGETWGTMRSMYQRVGKNLRREDVALVVMTGDVCAATAMLAKQTGFKTVVAAVGNHSRRNGLEAHGIKTIDYVSEFGRFVDDDGKYNAKAAREFAKRVAEVTDGKPLIGIQLHGGAIRLALSTALTRRRNAVLGTVGWQEGVDELVARAAQCIGRVHEVNTHYATTKSVDAAFAMAGPKTAPILDSTEFGWDDIPEMIYRLGKGKLDGAGVARIIDPELIPEAARHLA